MKKLCLVILLAGCAMQKSSLESAAMRYIGVPYVLDPLGEGQGAQYDPDPVYRTDAFDCLTFVETVLSESSGLDLQKIRYKDGNIDWFKRNHWTETDWIPNTVSMGLIGAIKTGHHAETFARVDLQKWYKDKTGVNYGAAMPFEMSVPYVPRVDLTQELLAKMPQDAIVFFIRCGVDNKFVRGDMIAHTGFLFGNDLIHAGQDTGVVRVNLFEYMKDSKFCGIAVYEVF
ncbi:MAG: DUF1460 domain-containing protein [Alphaproteobacteria bacterium]|nr:DUF1460 domain-containing protein [Alphaproteobacteria bacterium]